MMCVQETIVAPVTPPLTSGVGIIRLSGKKATSITQKVCQITPEPRIVQYCSFYDEHNQLLDMGLCLYFENPHSFTGEDVVEWQVHGSPVVIDQLIQMALSHGARLAEPGEFSKRAFLNDKMDLTQCEAVADLINSASRQSARLAVRSLQGDFSKTIKQITDKLINLRVYIESSIDFVDEDIELLTKGNIKQRLIELTQSIQHLLNQANNSVCLQEGLQVVIAGKPNAGKSSLLNVLSQKETAIVTDLPGTTRDVLRELIQIDGIPLHIIDTAGLRENADQIENEGIKRAIAEIKNADVVLLVRDASCETQLSPLDEWKVLIQTITDDKTRQTQDIPVVLINNKIDLTNQKPDILHYNNETSISISAKNNQGVDFLRDYLKHIAGHTKQSEGLFLARRRHIDALEQTSKSLFLAQEQLSIQATECVAEELRQAQLSLDTITGVFTSDDLLGKIFSEFCIGK